MSDFIKTELFRPDVRLKESQTMSIKPGGQITVVAFGLSGNDKVKFEVVLTPAIAPDNCKCPPGKVELPSVGASAPLIKCGVQPTLDANNSFIVLDAPQNVGLRAVLEADDVAGIYVIALSSNTADVTDLLRGYSCGE